MLSEIPVVPQQPPDGMKDFDIRPKTIDITVRGPLNSMTELVSGNGLSVRVPLDGLKPGKYERLPMVVVPKKIELVKMDPKVVEIVIRGDIIESDQ